LEYWKSQVVPDGFLISKMLTKEKAVLAAGVLQLLH
jgi:hypothetical protein